MATRSKQLEGILGRAIATTPKVGSSALLSAESVVIAPTPAAQPPEKPRREKEVRLQIDVPEPVRRAIKARAVENGESAREVILRALQRDGFDIPDTIIRDRRR
jgi:hypothetical protein